MTCPVKITMQLQKAVTYREPKKQKEISPLVPHEAPYSPLVSLIILEQHLKYMVPYKAPVWNTMPQKRLEGHFSEK